MRNHLAVDIHALRPTLLSCAGLRALSIRRVRTAADRDRRLARLLAGDYVRFARSFAQSRHVGYPIRLFQGLSSSLSLRE